MLVGSRDPNIDGCWHYVHRTDYMESHSESQGYYVLRAECDIMATWAGRRCGSPFATSAGTGGYRRPRTRRIARQRCAVQPCGIRVVLTAGRGRRGSRRGAAASPRRGRTRNDYCSGEFLSTHCEATQSKNRRFKAPLAAAPSSIPSLLRMSTNSRAVRRSFIKCNPTMSSVIVVF